METHHRHEPYLVVYRFQGVSQASGEGTCGSQGEGCYYYDRKYCWEIRCVELLRSGAGVWAYFFPDPGEAGHADYAASKSGSELLFFQDL